MMMKQGYSPNAYGYRYKFWVGPARVPRRVFVDHPKANHSHLDYLYRKNRNNHVLHSYNKRRHKSKTQRRNK